MKRLAAAAALLAVGDQAQALLRIAHARMPNARIKFFEITTLGG